MTVQIPDFPYTGHYYQEILEDLIRYMRNSTPELSDEDPVEPHIQLLRAYALASHLSNVLADHVGNEMFLPTAKLRASHRALLALIGVKLNQASPASADVLLRFTQTFSSAVTTIPAKTLFATLETRGAATVDFEVLGDVTLEARTDLVDKVYSYDGANYTDHSAEAQTNVGDFTPAWNVNAGDALYIGHRSILFDQIRFIIAVGSTGINNAVWEYFDGNMDLENPSSVTNLGDRLRFNINSLLGTSDRSGSVVRVRSNTTGGFEDLMSTFAAGENRIETIPGPNAFLGQSVPSTAVGDYTIGSEWRELTGLDDGTTDLTLTGERDVTFTLPQTLTQNWRKTTIGEGILAVDAYWIRYRIIEETAATPPDITEVRIHDGNQYQVVEASQGRSRSDTPLGSSDGSSDQEFKLVNSPVIDDDNIEIIVDEGGGNEREYTQVENFLASIATDRHYTIAFDDDGIATIKFGDGVTGKIPPAGSNNIRANYRTMDEVDGNVGSNTITVNRSGVAYITGITNPRPASGYAAKEGSTDADLARIKVAGPATLRTRERAVSPEDAEQVARTFVASDGSRPVARALAIEEAFGPKTIEVVVVGQGGAQVASSKLQEIQDNFNGTETVKGKILMNNQATVTNFTPLPVDVTAVVTGGELSAILTALTGILNPLTLQDDGVTYKWSFGGTVPLAALTTAIMNTSPKPRNCLISLPAADLSLATRELPVVGTLNITVNP